MITAFIVFCIIGLILNVTYMWFNLKETNEWIEKSNREMRELERRIKQQNTTVPVNETKPIPANTSDLKAQVLKKKH